MDAGRLQNPTIAAAGAKAACCSSCCCNAPSAHAHCQVLPNVGWRRSSIGLTVQHHRGASHGKRGRMLRRSVVEASLVDDVAVVAVAAVVATMLPLCWHYLSKARSSDTNASASSSPVSSSATSAVEAAERRSSTIVSDATPTTSSRLTLMDTVNCVSPVGEVQAHASASRSKDADIVTGCSSGTGIAFLENETSCARSGGDLASSSSSHACLSELEIEDKERRTADPEIPSSYAELAAVLLDVSVNTRDTTVLRKDDYRPTIVARQKKDSANGIDTADMGTNCHRTTESDKEEIELDSAPHEKESRINGVSAIGESQFSNVAAPQRSKEDLQTSQPSSNGSLSASLVKRSSLDLRSSPLDVEDRHQTAGLGHASLLQDGTETSLSPMNDLDERTNGCSADKVIEQDSTKVGNTLSVDGVHEARIGQNGSLLSTTVSTSASAPSSRKSPRKSLQRGRRKQGTVSHLSDLWEEFLRAKDGAVSEVWNFEAYESLYQRLLRADRIQDCLEVLESADKLGLLDMDKIYHAKFFDACKRLRAVKEAFRFTQLIKNPLLSTYNQLLSVCARAKDVQGAFEVFSSLEKAGLKADCILYTTLISVCGKAGKVDLVFQVFHEMVNAGVEPNVHTYGALIDGCSRAGQVGKAFGVYGIMRSKKLKPDRVIFNSLITACGRSGALERAFDVFSEMSAEPVPVKPNHVTIGALIKACTHAGQVDRALKVYQMMQDKGFKGSAEAYTEAVHACSRSGDLDTAYAIYNDMKSKCIQPDEIFFCALIDVAGHAGQLDICFHVLEEMKQIGLEPGDRVYSSIMGACSNSGSWERGLALYRDMLAASLSPTISTMNAMLTALCGAGQLKEALNILEEMRCAGLARNYITYTVLLKAFEKADDIGLAFDLYKKAASEGVVPTSAICESVTGICLHQIWKLTSGSNPTSSVDCIASIPFCHKCISWALLVYRETLASGVIPTTKTFSQLLGCLRLPRTTKDNFSYNYGMSPYNNHQQFSLHDGFGVYDPRALALFEDAASLGIVPSFSYTEGPINVDVGPMPVFIAEVCLLTLLKGFKYHHAAGARLPSMTILLAVEEKELVSPGSKRVTITSRTSQAIAALLRRLKLNFHARESSGKLKISPKAIRRWLQPTPTKQSHKLPMWQLNSGPQHLSLGKRISEQQRMIRNLEPSRLSPQSARPPNYTGIQHRPITNGAHLESIKPDQRDYQDTFQEGQDRKDIKSSEPQMRGLRIEYSAQNIVSKMKP